MGRSKVASDELLVMAKEEDIDIMMVQEPYVVEGRVAHMNRISNTVIECLGTDDRPWACLVSLNEDYTLTMIKQVCTAHCVCAHVIGPTGEFYVVSVYCQFSRRIEDFLVQLRSVLVVTRGKKTIIGMDANAISALWNFEGPVSESGSNYANGQLLEEFIMEHCLVPLNAPGNPSTFTKGRYSIDVSLVTSDMAANLWLWKVWDARILSDHRPITFSLTREEGLDVFKSRRFNTAKANWRKFSKIVDRSTRSLVGCALDDRSDIEAFVDLLTNVVVKASDSSMPVKKRHKKSVPWWSRELTDMKKRVNRLRREYQREVIHELRQNKKAFYLRERKAYTRRASSARQSSWRAFIEKESENEAYGLVYKIATERVSARKALETVVLDGVATVDWQETAKGMLDGLFGRQERASVQVRPLARPVLEHLEWGQRETEKAIRKMKKGKAPGEDRIEVEHLRYITKSRLFGQVVRLLNACFRLGVFPSQWKCGSVRVLLKSRDKDPALVKSYRPICLLSVMSKVLERLMSESLRPVIMDQRFASEHQYAYRKGRGTVNAIERLRNIISGMNDGIVLAVFFDISGAFDNLRWKDVMDELTLRGCPAQLCNLVQDYLSERKVAINERHCRIVKELDKGCPQGSILGPEFWNICLDGLLRALESEGISFVAYADDLVILVGGGSRRKIEREAQKAADLVSGWCNEKGLSLSESKSELLLIRDKVLKGNARKRHAAGSLSGSVKNVGKGGVRPPSVKVNGKNLKLASSVRYLGVTFKSGLLLSEHVQVAGDRAKRTVMSLMRVSRANWGLSCRYMSMIYRSVYVPTVLYAVEAWGDLAGPLSRKLEQIQRFALHRVCKTYCTCSTVALQVLACEMPMDLLVKQKIGRYRISKGLAFVWNDWAYECNADKSEGLHALNEKAMNEWNDRWISSEKGMVTRYFFPTVKDRLACTHLRLSHYVVQFMSGHGNFKAKLRGFGLNESGECGCGLEDTAMHELFECDLFEDERMGLRECADRLGIVWPPSCQQLVQTQEMFKAFEGFCITVGRKKELLSL
uniref:Reverse transcriptase domain-containing protein n=1 Tax=Trichogramma kaykai TaxID=54128 RepID=A0ABD2VXI4_9HYME